MTMDDSIVYHFHQTIYKKSKITIVNGEDEEDMGYSAGEGDSSDHDLSDGFGDGHGINSGGLDDFGGYWPDGPYGEVFYVGDRSAGSPC